MTRSVTEMCTPTESDLAKNFLRERLRCNTERDENTHTLTNACDFETGEQPGLISAVARKYLL